LSGAIFLFLDRQWDWIEVNYATTNVLAAIFYTFLDVVHYVKRLKSAN